jgi:hypothetical protein
MTDRAREQRWALSHRADKAVVPLADRHYNRQKVGAPQFVPPGACVVLTIPGAAFWITSWPLAEYVKHEWAGAWVNSAFRNERRDLYLSSELITEAVAATLAVWPEPPELGLVTFVDPTKTRPKRDPGRCYRKAGFVEVGRTKKDKLVALQLLPEAMPEPLPALGTQERLAV